MAIDYGQKRTGIAVTDPLKIIASPLTTVATATLLDYLKTYCFTEEIEAFVVGLPLHADGRESEMSAETRRFAGWLASATGLPVEFQDERYTSAAAAGRLAGVGLSRGSKKARSDAVAAQIMLETWMARRAVERDTHPERGLL